VPAVPVTGLYAALCALLVLALALAVIRSRWRTKAGLGDGGDRRLARAIRIHGNAVEYVPLALVLLLVAELNHAGPALLHGCGATLVAARVAHAIGLSRTAGVSFGRMLGTVGTFGVVIVLAAVDLAAFLR
jgi:uncharacterized membrane protein YecN with MAPEG domain